MYNSKITHTTSSCIVHCALCIVFLISSCSSCNNRNNQTTTPAAKSQTSNPPVPVFNADSAYAFVKAQVDFGPRVPNTKEHDACAEYLIGKLKSYTPNVIVQKGQVTTYNKVKLNIQNIIAQFNSGTNNRVLLFAHWDTRPWADQDPDVEKQDEPILGADDAGSGVAVLLEIARQLSTQKLPIGVDIILFDAEDYGTKKNEQDIPDSYALGTQYWCKNLVPAGYTANYGILLDMVGARNATFRQEGLSMEYAPAVVEKVWNTAQQLGFGSYFPYEQGPTITDDHAYPNRILNLPCIDIINLPRGTSTFGNYWHTHRDNMDIIDKNTLNAVGQTLLAVLFSEAEG